ncbi:MAG TPA: hypothetical protein DD795_10335, partial [Erythrobacter sp.]|nr:hypothetical protein [Erythrobacter sp.]
EARVDTGAATDPVVDDTTTAADRALMTAEERAQAVEDRLGDPVAVDGDLETDTDAELDMPGADAEVDADIDTELETQPDK